MSGRYRRNIGKKTTAAEAEARILAGLARRDRAAGAPASSLAYMAFPGYDFRNPQGAALAVGRIMRGMYDRGLIRLCARGHGYVITNQGLSQADNINQVKEPT